MRACLAPLFAAALISGAAPVGAQTIEPPETSASTSDTATSDERVEEQISPERLSAAHRLVEILIPPAHYAERAEAEATPIFNVIVSGYRQNQQLERALDMSPETAQAFEQFLVRMRAFTVARTESYLPLYSAAVEHFYARHFDVSELEEIIRFYSTPVGMAFAARAAEISSDPEIIQATRTQIAETREAMQPILEEFRAEVARIISKTHDQ